MRKSVMYKMACAKCLLEGVEVSSQERFRNGQAHCGLATGRKTLGRRWDQAWRCVECSGWRKETSVTDTEQSIEVRDGKHESCPDGEGPWEPTDAGAEENNVHSPTSS